MLRSRSRLQALGRGWLGPILMSLGLALIATDSETGSDAGASVAHPAPTSLSSSSPALPLIARSAIGSSSSNATPAAPPAPTATPPSARPDFDGIFSRLRERLDVFGAAERLAEVGPSWWPPVTLRESEAIVTGLTEAWTEVKTQLIAAAQVAASQVEALQSIVEAGEPEGEDVDIAQSLEAPEALEDAAAEVMQEIAPPAAWTRRTPTSDKPTVQIAIFIEREDDEVRAIAWIEVMDHRRRPLADAHLSLEWGGPLSSYRNCTTDRFGRCGVVTRWVDGDPAGLRPFELRVEEVHTAEGAIRAPIAGHRLGDAASAASQLLYFPGGEPGVRSALNGHALTASYLYRDWRDPVAIASEDPELALPQTAVEGDLELGTFGEADEVLVWINDASEDWIARIVDRPDTTWRPAWLDYFERFYAFTELDEDGIGDDLYANAWHGGPQPAGFWALAVPY